MRNTLPQTIGIVVVACLILTGGIVHGLMTNRWDRQDDALVLAKRLDSFPEQVSVWELKSDENNSSAASE